MQALERKCKGEMYVNALITNGYHFVFHLKNINNLGLCFTTPWGVSPILTPTACNVLTQKHTKKPGMENVYTFFPYLATQLHP